MTCECCTRMNCIYTLPIPGDEMFRFRLYKCPTCKRHDETLEIPKKNVTSETLKGMMEKARQRRFVFVLKAVKKQAKAG